MLSPSLSLTFSESIIIFRGFAKASAAVNSPYGAAFCRRFAALWHCESGNFLDPRAPVTGPICLRDVSLGLILTSGAQLVASTWLSVLLQYQHV